MTAPIRTAAVAVVAVVAVAVASLVPGAWWAAFVAGLIVGGLVARAWVAVVIGAAVGVLAWGVPLAVGAVRYGVGGAASALSAILGFGHNGALAIALTLLVGLLLGLTGAWLTSAVRGILVASRARVDARKA